MLGRSTTRHSQRPVLETFEERVLFKKKGNKIAVDPYFALRLCSSFFSLDSSVLKKREDCKCFSAIDLNEQYKYEGATCRLRNCYKKCEN